ncbi:hypothetical protein EXIGLDRAFT_729267 [Exidia glandulosa HHB12029]|uniref:Protein kinase domain-containing protein n=1 Tax=Exidia glandulosa HHB12029 TaxID=1314781 RepID=A0A165CP52_EXIGL|nr:hypothetical protein EXIGLDRAFT_729267 [Exidia glandulosa HHB12029]
MQHDLLSVDALLARIDNMGADMLNEPARRSIERLVREVPGDLLPVQVELFFYGALALHDQHRVDDILASSATPYALNKHELFWTSLYPILRQAGYTLRARYAPGWQHHGPQQVKGDSSFWGKFPEARALHPFSFRAVPAVSMRTGANTFLKVLHTRRGHPNANEIDILKYLNEEPRRSHPHNICVPVHDYIRVPSTSSKIDPEISIAVMPALRPSIRFEDCMICGFVLHGIKQLLQGLAFLHSHGIAHRVTWTGGQIELPEVPLHSVWDRSPLDASVRYDPFAADIFALYQACYMNFERLGPFFEDLCDRMEATDPAKRPSAADCVRLFQREFERLPRRCFYRATYSLKAARIVDGWAGVAHTLVHRALAVCWFWIFGDTV